MAWPMVTVGNPYTETLYASMKARGADVTEFSLWRLLRSAPAVWHLHWPDHVLKRANPFYAMIRGLALLTLVTITRFRGCKIVWTAHNLHSHEQVHPKIERWFWRHFVRRLDGYISLSRRGKELVLEQFPALHRIPGFVVPLGHYRGIYPHGVSRQDARATLSLPHDTLVLGFVGRILTYKNVAHLVTTYRRLDAPGSVLLVAGEPMSPGVGEAVRAAAANDPRVRLVLQHVPGEMLQVYLAASDLVVFPYRDILNSSSALLALSFDRPVLVPRLGSMAELRETMGPEWVATYDGDLNPAHLGEAMAWVRQSTRGACEALDRLNWSGIAEDTLHALREISGAEVS